MARAAVLGRLTWRVAEVLDVVPETPRVKTIAFDVSGWPGHRAGQHVDIRLTAEDGYPAQRSDSLASTPDGTRVELTVEGLDDGEVSPYLLDVLRPGDGLEVRGPIGGWFAWDPAQGGPLLLVAGGSGVVPLMAMLRHHARAPADVRARIPVRLLYSVRTPDDVIFRDELAQLARAPAVELVITVTREHGAWEGRRGRIDRALLQAATDAATTSIAATSIAATSTATGAPAVREPLAFVCGPTPFVEAVATLLVELGWAPARVRTERFGPTGDVVG